MDRLGRALMERWSDYLKLSSTGADYSAIVRLGEFENLLRSGGIPQPLADKWHYTLDGEQVPEKKISRAISELKDELAQLKRVMKYGTEFIFEETMLLITLRVRLQLALEFFESRNITVECDLKDVDRELLKIARSGKNLSAYESARRRARKNWGLPIRSEWLGR